MPTTPSLIYPTEINNMYIDPAEDRRLDKEDVMKMEDPLALFRNNPIWELDEEPPEPEVVEDAGKADVKLVNISNVITPDEYMYVMDNYTYDPNDEVVNNYNEVEAENFIRNLVIEYRKKNNIPI